MTKISSKVLLPIAFGLLALTVAVNGVCDVCSNVSYAACINETSFRPCFDGVVKSNEIVTCPEGMHCTDQQGVCSSDPTVEMSCNLQAPVCNDCTGIFTCVTQTQFGFCTTDGQIVAVGNCEDGKVCSVESFNLEQQICALSCVFSPTCSNTEPLLPPVKDVKESCNGITAAGFYTNVADPTCKTYVYCEEVNTIMTVLTYTCTTGYFDGTTHKCTTVKPDTCT